MAYYILDELGNPVKKSASEIRTCYPTPEERRIAWDMVNGYVVSTVFLVLDYNTSSEGYPAPILFETMVFYNSLEDIYMERYCTKEAALQGHAKIIGMIKAGEITSAEASDVVN